MLLHLKRLFTDLDVYLELSAGRLRTVIGLSLLGLLLLSFINATAVVLTQGPKLLQSLSQLADTAVSWWPADQVGQWRDGKLTFSPADTAVKLVAWPFPAPENLTKQLVAYSPQTLTEPTTDFRQGDTSALIFVSPDQFWVNQLNDGWSEPMPLTEMIGFTELAPGEYDKTGFAHLVGQAQNVLRKLLLMSLVLWPFLSVLGSWLSMAWFIVTEAALVWIITKLFGWHFSWVRLVKLNCLLVIPATAVQYLAGWIYPELTFSLFHITYWILLTLVLLVGSKQLERAT